jgi:hypothetical protein
VNVVYRRHLTRIRVAGFGIWVLSGKSPHWRFKTFPPIQKRQLHNKRIFQQLGSQFPNNLPRGLGRTAYLSPPHSELIPVAIRSSTTTTRSASVSLPFCISKTSLPYSLMYSAWTTSPGSFPLLRMGTKRTLRRRARTGAKINPRASRPTITVGSRGRICDSRMSS